ncbi:protein-L-isoaspartate O-methyltransferase [Novosphingobium flavum]|uniref:Protein-L-isoaspartate O-methyltransferase n=1 Tax=Novosphingobium flavum TaxID=1778672 RepID=A0A7X1FPE5_9SPHN|nr:protein-L-isoaspartate O-methyltransferase [Novosphingobium flavum]MBC2664564.1 protein-L-isoaspartate O-methyltransferase [Novosphingobium flavum]
MTVLDERPLAARRAMIDSQLRVSGVNEPAVLAAFDAVAREDFVPEALKANAYIDRALPLEGGAMLPAPLVHGRMLIEARPAAGEDVLVVSASGYLAALLGQFGCKVAVQEPAEAAAAKKGSTVSLILIDGAVEQVPTGLAARLAEGGRIVTGTVERGVTRLASGTKIGGALALFPLADIGMPVLSEFAAPRAWSF